MYEEVHSEDTQGFHVTLSIRPEDMHPRDVYGETEEIVQDMCDKINRGSLLWFIARVDVYRHKVLLATEHLGGCMYDNIQDFIEGDYYADMVDNAINEAKRTLTKLQA